MSPPIDFSSPPIALYLSLVRLQVLTPLALLMNLATTLVCSFLVHPPLERISALHLNSLTPNPLFVGVYWLAIYAGQIGFCLLLVFARKEETKKTLVSLGLSLVFANWVTAAWALSWILQFFIAATVFLGLLTLLLVYANLNLLLRSSNAPTSSRPLDVLLIHVPIRLFLIMPLNLMVWLSLFIALGHTSSSDSEELPERYHWEGMAVITATNALGLLVVALRRDFVWCFGAMWTTLSILLGPRKGGLPVLISCVTFLVLYPITLFLVTVWHKMRQSPAHGPIALPPDENGPDEEVERFRIRVEADEERNGHDHTDDQQKSKTLNQANEQQSTVEEAAWG